MYNIYIQACGMLFWSFRHAVIKQLSRYKQFLLLSQSQPHLASGRVTGCSHSTHLTFISRAFVSILYVINCLLVALNSWKAGKLNCYVSESKHPVSHPGVTVTSEVPSLKIPLVQMNGCTKFLESWDMSSLHALLPHDIEIFTVAYLNLRWHLHLYLCYTEPYFFGVKM